MPVRLESSLQRSVISWAREHGFLAMKMQTITNVGWPDVMFIAPNGRLIWIEFKQPGMKLDPIQVYVHKQLSFRKQRVYTCNNRYESICHLKEALDAAPLPA